MEVATTNNHNQSHHHHQQQQQRMAQQFSLNSNNSNRDSSNSMMLHSSNGARSPFQREVREWQRIDPDTGALLTGRLEADRWINGPLNSYGKKSSSSISSNNSSNSSSMNNIATTAATMNTHHKTASKISLHAIVANNNNNSNNKSNNVSDVREESDYDNDNDNYNDSEVINASSPTTTSSTTTYQQQRSSRFLEQATLFGQRNNSNSNNSSNANKSRVGANEFGAGGGGGGGDDGAVSDIAAELRQQRQQNFGLTPTRWQRRDLESFRHYNDTHDNAAADHIANANADDDDDADLRLTTRHQRRQQLPNFTTTLQRARSISTDDLSSEWQTPSTATLEEPAELRRVSKLRRSFQSTTNSNSSNDSYNQSTPGRRPLDLPTHSVSVSRIRAELENGRRLNTAMRNNHVDLAALHTLLNSPAASATTSTKTTTEPTKRSSVLTAESLKEIRGKLKRLSDENLYKDDFIARQQAPVEELHIEVPQVLKTPAQRVHQITPAESPEARTTPKSAFQYVAKQQPQHTTNSLESRQKNRDTSSAEWHLRRKSYGFEKMSPPDDKTMFRMDASTDSGLGRSGELGNWSPTEHANATARSTVIHFGGETHANNTLQPRLRQLKSPLIKTAAAYEQETRKRHSIAVDESQYVRDNLRKTSQVHINVPQTTLYDASESTTQQTNSNSLFQRTTQQKRVEFCKTEVHFAAESGRVNIVETDGKPPPTNNFRRRRRTTTGPLQSLTVKSNDDYQHKSNAYKTGVVDADVASSPETKHVTVSVPKVLETATHVGENIRNSYASTSGIDTTDDEIATIRGILKNKPIKPKPYHLGENIDSADALWGVQLKPISGPANVTIRDSTTQETLIAKTKSDSTTANFGVDKSVAERIRIVEKRQDVSSNGHSNGFSTKINLSLGETSKDWHETDYPKTPKTNIMNIELHSPQSALTPVAKPRTSSNDEIKPQATTHTPPSSEPTKEPLKIIKEARGARKLREHELSYFGVQVSKNDAHSESPTKLLPTITSLKTKRTLPQRKLSEHNSLSKTEIDLKAESKQQMSKWQLLNDKPDLLRHSPIAVEPLVITRIAEIKPVERKSLRQLDAVESEREEHDDDEHFYENITNELTPVFRVKSHHESDGYDRKMDLQRDAMILSEMTRNADQTMKALSDEAALKDQRRRATHSQRRHSKPLETIDEKAIAEKINDNCIAVKVTRSTYASDAKRSSRHSTPSPTRVEGCPRARSRSLSSERDENERTKMRATRSGASLKSKQIKSQSGSRSSSRDSERSAQTTPHCSSGEEFAKPVERMRSTKMKRISSGGSSNTREKRSSKERSEQREKHKSTHDERQRHHRHSSTTRSTQRERSECATDAIMPHQQQRRLKPTTTTTTTESTSSRSQRRKDDGIVVGRSSSDKHSRTVSGVHLTRTTRSHQHEHDAQKIERGDKEKDKDKLPRSKGNSSRSSKSEQSRHITTPTLTPKLREHHRKSATSGSSNKPERSEATAKQLDNMTHSKNAQLLNGQQPQHQHHHHHHHHQQQQQPQQHVHSLTTATIAAKQRERAAKDRK